MDEHDRVIGTASRHEVHSRQLRHRAVHIFLFNPAGQLFLQQRSHTKDTFPGCYDSSASGHLDTGETYDACAIRELREELGIVVSLPALRPLHRFTARPETGQEFVWLYELMGEYIPQINTEEIMGGKFWELGQIESEILKKPSAFARSFIHIFQHCRQNGLKPSSDNSATRRTV